MTAPAQAAYEAAVATGETTTATWDELPHMRRRAWEAIARAAIEAFVQQPAPLVVDIPGILSASPVADAQDGTAHRTATREET